MATYTTNYNLKKPAAEDFYNVQDQNGNMDTIDQALNGIATSVAGKADAAATTTALAGKANSTHTHTKSQITDFPSTMAPTAHTHTKSQITDFPSTMTPAAHNQSAATIQAGTFAGQVVAPAGTDYTTNRIRNGIFTTTDPGANASTTYANGSVIYVYE